MPDILDANGLQISTASEIRQALVEAFQEIYGADINLESNSPDGQIIGIFTQAGIDIREKVFQIYNSFDPDRAIGRQLDERVVLNHLARAGGTYTLININVTVDRTVTLPGLDAAFNDINGTGFTVQDNAGTQFILIDTVTLTTGTTSLAFRAKNIGRVETTVGTITSQTTIVLGVTAVNNPSAPTTLGQNEETDSQLRSRRQQSPAISANGYLNGLLGLVLSLEGVSGAALYENTDSTTDANGIPAKSIWLIAEGGANSDIADALYDRKSYGAGMKGAVTVNITTPSGGTFAAKFDRPTSVNLYIRFDLKRTAGLAFVYDLASIKQYIVDNLTYGISQFAETSDPTAIARAGINAQGGGGVPINTEISTDGTTWVDFIAAPTLASKFVLDVSRITITVVA